MSHLKDLLALIMFDSTEESLIKLLVFCLIFSNMFLTVSTFDTSVVVSIVEVVALVMGIVEVDAFSDLVEDL